MSFRTVYNILDQHRDYHLSSENILLSENFFQNPNLSAFETTAAVIVEAAEIITQADSSPYISHGRNVKNCKFLILGSKTRQKMKINISIIFALYPPRAESRSPEPAARATDHSSRIPLNPSRAERAPRAGTPSTPSEHPERAPRVIRPEIGQDHSNGLKGYDLAKKEN
ncbi:Uncharacterized protein Rs2_32198 [Raphanus sativus]|nr:Uncharacterized protein Rs2_32198 [Raphanus sativus]